MNRYRHVFFVLCPANDGRVAYELVIWTPQMIMVEEIVAECQAIERGYHEDIADKLALKFGGAQILTAEHHGVEIVTTRGPGRIIE